MPLLLVAALSASFAGPGELLEPGSSDGEDVPRGAADLPLQRVTGGEDVADGDWPDAVAVYLRESGETYVGCTGTLIAPDLVITAGHCVIGVGVPKVRIGSVWDDTGGELITVKQAIEYPRSQTTGADVAVLILDHASSIPPRTIAKGCVRDEIVDGADVAVVGWGAIDNWGDQYIDRLQEGFTVVTDADCSNTSRGCSPTLQPAGEIGAGGGGIDACYGDSGGPLYLLTDHGDFLVGVTSRAYDDVRKPCGEGGIWVRADKVASWVETVTGRTLPDPVCGNAPRPTAEPLVVAKNHAGFVRVDPNDPDEGDSFVFTVVQPAEHGVVEVSTGGVVTFDPDRGYVGDDLVRVAVRDASGLVGQVEVPISVLTPGDYRDETGEPAGCACDSSGSGLGLAPLLALLVLRRRRGARVSA